MCRICVCFILNKLYKNTIYLSVGSVLHIIETSAYPYKNIFNLLNDSTFYKGRVLYANKKLHFYSSHIFLAIIVSQQK